MAVQPAPAALAPVTARIRAPHWHFALAGAVLVTALAYPRTGQAGVLVPLPTRSTGEAIAWLRGDGATILGPARDGHHFVIRMTSEGTALRALSRGWLLIAVPDLACGPTPEQRT